MPLYEYLCGGCGERFEELVGAHVGKAAAEVRCPACGGAEVERLLSGQAPLPRGLTPNQRRRLESKRGIDRDGARQRFKRSRKARASRER